MKITFTYRFSFMQKTLAICLWVFIALSSTNVLAQFTVMEDFRGGGNPDIILGNSATLTSGVADPLNQGWLRLTRTTTNSKGYAFIDKSFPSSLGVLVDFEYKTWRDVNDSYRGADGLSIFLFDGTVDKNSFVLGGDGGSLGYSKKDAIPGLYKGYIGIGLDEYGNFANPSDGAKPGGPGERPNSVVLRGPTTSSNTTTNRYLLGKTIVPNGTGFLYQDITTNTGLREDNVIDFNTNTATRPTDTQFYRRVQIEIEPLVNGNYNIIVRWKTKPTDTNFTEILSYETTDVPPGLLKVGFAAATGGGVNYHEIRNLLVTTPNNIRVVKRADKEILSKVTGTGTENQITYTIEVTNATNSTSNVPNISFYDGLRDVDGTLIPKSNGTTTGFYIDTASMTTTGFISASLTASNTTSEITGTLALAPNATGIITVKGKLIGMIPQGNLLINTVTVTPPAGFDDDLNNNTYKVETPVVAEGVDMTVNQAVDDSCADGSNTFTVIANSMGTSSADLTYERIRINGSWTWTWTKRLKLVITVPTGYTYTPVTTTGWDLNSSSPSGTYTYLSNQEGTLAGQSYPYPLVYRISKNAAPFPAYSTTATITYINSSGNNIEDVPNRVNNSVTTSITAIPAAPVVTTAYYYCQGDTATPLTATATGTNQLKWYFSATGGTASNFAPTPTTTTAGTQSYWVSQINGSCESPRALITVTVYGKPTAGVIAGNKNICNNTTPTGGITSSTNGTVTGSGNITYKWESFSAPTNTWTTIPGTLATYAPGNLTTTTRYRRTTISTNGSTVCTSDTSNEVTITVSIPTDPGIITGDQSICSGKSTTILTGTTATGTGTLTYRWESAPETGSIWTTVGTSPTYSPGSTLTATTRYRRITIATSSADASGNVATCSATSNIVTIIVYPTPIAGSIGGDQKICNGEVPNRLNSVTPGALAAGDTTGTLGYQWQVSTSTPASWNNISGATNADYQPLGLITTTQYRRITTSTHGAVICESAATAPVTITVLPIISRGSASGNQTICMDTKPTSLIGSTYTVAAPISSVVYRWESSPTNDVTSVWTAIPGATLSNYAPPVVHKTTYYRRITIATSTGGANTAVCESAPTDVVTVTTKNCVVITNPMIYQRVN